MNPTKRPPNRESLSRKKSQGNPQTRTYTTSACTACRQRKCKCSGGLPCQKCIAMNTECVYSEAEDRRTKAVRGREKEELEILQIVVDGVFRAIRGTDTHGVLALVRQNASLGTIANALAADNSSLLQMQTPSDDVGALDLLNLGLEADLQLDLSSSDTIPLPTDPISANEIENMDLSHLQQPYTNPGGPRVGSSVETWPTSSTRQGQSGRRYLLQPPHEKDKSSLENLSSLYIKFRNASHHINAQGLQATGVDWSSPVACENLLKDHDLSVPFSISTWAAAIVNISPNLDLFFRLAWLVLLSRFMRWSVTMGEESFEKLPDVMKPTTLQLSTPHPPFIDLAPLPQIRDALMRNPRDFIAAFASAGVSVRWEAPLEAAVHHDVVNGHTFVSEMFERHISIDVNFRFGKRLLESFPELEGSVNVAEEEFIPPTLVAPEWVQFADITTQTN